MWRKRILCKQIFFFKKKQNNKLIETLDNLENFELSNDESLDFALKNNRGVVEIVTEDEYEESDYEKTSNIMENSLISLDDHQWEEFTVDNENQEVKGDCVLLIIQKEMVHKKI